MKLTKASRRRVITTASLSAAASALFLGPQLLVPGAGLSWFTALAGLGFPAAVGFAGLGIAQLTGALGMVDTRTSHKTQAEPVRKGARR